MASLEPFLRTQMSTDSSAYLGTLSKLAEDDRHLFLPFIVTLLSAGILISQFGAHTFKSRNGQDQERNTGDLDDRVPVVRRVIAQNGGSVIFLFMIARVLGCMGLVGASIPAVLRNISEKDWAGSIHDPRVDGSLLLANSYALILSSLALATPSWRKRLTGHANIILLTELGVYVYRDLWPLATLDGTPADLADGWLVWGRIAVLVFVAVVIPVCIPNIYKPLDPKNPAAEVNPEQTASLLSRKTYAYLTPTITAANRTAHLKPDELPPMADYDRAQALATRALPHLDLAKAHKGRHIGLSLLRVFAIDFSMALIAVTFHSLFQFVTPVAVNRLLTLLEYGQTKDTVVRPWFWIACILIAPLMCSLTLQFYVFNTTGVAARTQSILTQLIFDHTLRVRIKAESSEVKAAGDPGKKAGSNFIGKLNNLVTVDLMNINGAADFLLLIYMLPIQLIGCSIFLYILLGWSALVGIALMFVLLPVPGYMIGLLQNVQGEQMKRTDSRTQIVTESLNVLRMVKLFGWERKIEQKVDQRREDEIHWLWKGKILIVIVMMVGGAIPTVTMLTTFATAALVMKTQLTAATIFSSMILFDNLRNQLQRANYILYLVTRGKVSLDRINAFFKDTELLDSQEPSIDAVELAQQDDFIGFRNANFVWSTESDDGSSTPSTQFKLSVPGEVQFVRGKINLIVGPTGSGKTSLLMALLGEMHFTPTHPDSVVSLPRGGGVSLAVQESWVLNETIRENILFHSPYDEERYKKVLCQCALEPDLELFEAGDRTEVGERGLTLSGGQKARLTLARAIYSSSQTILLDDILAALDVHTASWVVNKCLKGDLVQGRTVLLVTHNVGLAGPVAECIISVARDGVVTNRGHDISAVQLSDAIVESSEDIREDTVPGKQDELIDDPSDKNKPSGKLIVAEEIPQGVTSFKSLMFFLRALGGAHALVFFSIWIIGYLLDNGLQSFNLWFLGHWSSQYKNHPAEEVPVQWYMGTYAALTLLALLTLLSRDIWYTLGTLRSSRVIHRILFQSILGATLRWLDETPISRIITRMTQDIQTVDVSLTGSLDQLASLAFTMLIALTSAVLFVPLFTIPGLLIGISGIFIGNLYLKAQLSVKREMSNANAPLLAHFGEAMAGLVSIRAYGAQSSYKKESVGRIDHYVKLYRANNDLNRWVALRIDTLGAIFTASLAAYLTYASNISAANIGFSLNRAVEFCSVILHLVRRFNMFQVEANSLDRIAAYTEIEQEPKPTEDAKPPASWPTSGDLRVENLTAQYSKAGPDVLHGLSFSIGSGERVGVVGRTGSGKSSLTLALLRCILTDGTVYFDGLATETINLDALRSNITIIPQLPELLGGTLRYNLDPFEEYDDATLNAALRSSGLYGSQNDSEESRLTLDSSISSSGSNVSVGQRQIIALARAIIRSSKLLILDEATSAIDHDTDLIIQNTLRRELGSDVTVVTIAHRLRTIIDADRVMVMDAGRIVEFAPPAELLTKETGLFKSLVDESADKHYLYEVAGRAGNTN